MSFSRAFTKVFGTIGHQIKRVDIFGVALAQPISQNEKYQKSIIGGISTILTFILSLSYTVWIIVQWQSNQLNPKISSFYSTANFEHLDLTYNVIKIFFSSQTKSYINPFESKVLIPLYANTSSYNLNSTLSVLDYDSETKTLIPPVNFSKFQNNNTQTQLQFYVVFALCTKELVPDVECASDEIKAQFFAQQQNLIYIQVHQQQYNIQSKQIEQLLNVYYLQLDENGYTSLTLSLQTTNYEIQDDLIFGTPTVKQLITGTLMQTQSSSPQYGQQAYKIKCYNSLILVLYNTQIKMVIQYVTAGDLLANIGSICSSIFLLKYLIFALNRTSLQNNLIEELILMYYPNYKQITYDKNWRGKILKVYYNKNQIDLKEFQDKIKKIREQMSTKLTFINLLYETSRFFFIMRSFQSRESLRKSHRIGINLNFGSQQIQLSDRNYDIEINSPKFQQQLLNIEDVDLLSYKKQRILGSDVNDEIYNEQDFFELNKQF